MTTLTPEDIARREELLSEYRASGAVRTAELSEWHYYAGTGNTPNGRRVDMVPVKHQMSGSDVWQTVLVVLLDGRQVSTMGADGVSAALAHALRGEVPWDSVAANVRELLGLPTGQHLTPTTKALVAVRERLDGWEYPVAIVQFRDGDCETVAVPEAHLTDITWLDRGRERVVVNRLDRDDVAELLALADQGAQHAEH